jgi:acyl carrier protein
MANEDTTRRIVSEILVRHLPEPRDLKPNDHLQHDLGFDSLAVMEVVGDLEDRFRVTLGPELLERVHTVDDVVKLLAAMAPER